MSKAIKNTIIILTLCFAITATSANAAEPAVKKSSTGICHEKGSMHYGRTKNFTPYSSIKECITSGGRAAKPSGIGMKKTSGASIKKPTTPKLKAPAKTLEKAPAKPVKQ